MTEFDKQGRINITSPLIDYAGLKKECVVIGVGDRLEIWSEDKWNDFFDTNEDKRYNRIIFGAPGTGKRYQDTSYRY